MSDREVVVKSTQSVPMLEKAKTFELWKTEVEIWKEVTDIKAEKIGMTLALSLPEECKFGKNIKSSILEKISIAALKGNTGYDKVIQHLDTLLGKDKVVDKFERFNDFVDCKKTEEQSIEDFVSTFDSKLNRLISSGQKIDKDIMTYMILKNSNLQKWEISMVMSRIDFEKDTDVYESAKKQMRQVLGSNVVSTETSGNNPGGPVNVKSEPVFVAEGMQEAYIAQGYGWIL